MKESFDDPLLSNFENDGFKKEYWVFAACLTYCESYINAHLFQGLQDVKKGPPLGSFEKVPPLASFEKVPPLASFKKFLR